MAEILDKLAAEILALCTSAPESSPTLHQLRRALHASKGRVNAAVARLEQAGVVRVVRWQSKPGNPVRSKCVARGVSPAKREPSFDHAEAAMPAVDA